MTSVLCFFKVIIVEFARNASAPLHKLTPGSAENRRKPENSLLFSLFFDTQLAYSLVTPPSAATTARIASW
jgi:hypothetical protein